MDTGTVEELTRALKAADRPLVITGAGISVASGIAPFRGTDEAVWSKTVLEMGTRRMFQRDPARQWQWYLERFDSCRDARPNAAHLALVEFERLKRSQERSSAWSRRTSTASTSRPGAPT